MLICYDNFVNVAQERKNIRILEILLYITAIYILMREEICLYPF